MSKNEMYYNPNTDMWITKAEVIDSIQTITGCTEAEAVAHFENSIKENILYTYAGYNKHFKPFEN